MIVLNNTEISDICKGIENIHILLNVIIIIYSGINRLSELINKYFWIGAFVGTIWLLLLELITNSDLNGT